MKKITRGSRRRPMPLKVAPTKLTQTEQRQRRRTHQLHVLDGEFDLSTEVAAVVGPVAVALAAEPNPASGAAREAVENISAAVDALAREVGDMVADHRSRAAAVGDRGAARSAVRELVRRPVPAITDDELRGGSWAGALTEFVAPLAAPLARILGAAAQDRTRVPAESDAVIDALRGVDRSVLSLERKITAARRWRASRPNPEQSQAARGRDMSGVIAELDRLGIAHNDLTA
ncbi:MULTISPECIES: hypothetical protein [Tsukamurella]|uniref:Uncharacterized protein n=2 Tax=Tsukamurella TaxID=2060 RepID=A0A3P8MF09_TSUPA|nr:MULTISPECIES: hypothetical protein [Tsukamurella]NKY18168.1 hypothetical protein [Tsukamurella spumae]UEA84023.1 hypothetical protein LK411_04075 [Tsukamurella paurometabola]VDR41183.1 Uncharacterised protein [Tsukamurella paurometabola]